MMDITSTCTAFENDTNVSLAFERKQNKFPLLERNVDDKNQNQNSTSSTTSATDGTSAFERKKKRFPQRERNADDDNKSSTNDATDQMPEKPKQDQMPKPAKSSKAAKDISSLTEEVETALSPDDISQILPYNNILVDKVIEYEAGKRAVGIKTVSINEPQFTARNRSDKLILPGVMQIEALAQLVTIVCYQMEGVDQATIFSFRGVNGVKWQRPVVPGDTLVMEVKIKMWHVRRGIVKATGKAYVDGQIAIEIKEMMFAMNLLESQTQEKVPRVARVPP